MQTLKLVEWLNDTYSLSSNITSELIRSYNNDVYLIHAHTDQYVLKLYGAGWRTKSEIHYEIALVKHLINKGLRVANAIPGRDGQIVYTVPFPQSEQYAVLFEYAEGQKPQPPFSSHLYFSFGQAIARMHNCSDDFTTVYE